MIQNPMSFLNHGSSGGIDTFAVQIAIAFGKEVTAVRSSRNVELMLLDIMGKGTRGKVAIIVAHYNN